MATSLVNGQLGSDQTDVLHDGMLFKRQRGRSLRKGSGSGRMRLKFQPRFCVLNKTGFLYKPKKNDKTKVCCDSVAITVFVMD